MHAVDSNIGQFASMLIKVTKLSGNLQILGWSKFAPNLELVPFGAKLITKSFGNFAVIHS